MNAISDPFKKIFTPNKWLSLMLIFGILLGTCFLAYSNGLHNAFMWDDGPLFSDIKIKNIKFLPNAFFIQTPHSNPLDTFTQSNTYYRPMTYVISVLSYFCFKDNPFGYHVLNLFLFAMMCLMVYVFVETFFKNQSLALVTSLLFALHPINVFYVDYVTSGIHSLRFICILLILVLEKKGTASYFPFIKMGNRRPSLFLFVVALLCHEASMVLPLYVMAVLYYSKKLTFKETLRQSWSFWAVLGLYLVFRLYFTSLPSGTLRFDASPLVYLATFSRLVFLYITKLIFPEHIVFFWNSPLMQGANTFIWIAGLTALLAGWWQIIKNNPRSIASFCTTLFIISFIPIIWASHSHITDKNYGLIIEPQWVTVASVGFFLYAAHLGLILYARWKKGVGLFFILLLALLTFDTRAHNKIWGNEYNYYFYWSQQISPLPPINYFYLANIYAIKNELAQARYYFAKALEKYPNAEVYYNLGLIDMRMGNVNQAKDEFLLSVEKDPKFSLSYNNLGVIYFNQHDLNAAKEAFLKTVELDKYCIEARSNLGLIATMQGEYQKAIEYYQQNLRIDPRDQDSQSGLEQALRLLKQIQ